MFPKNRKGGVVTGTIFAVGGLIIGVIVVLLLTSTIGDANLIGNDAVNTYSKINESVTFLTNNTAQTLSANTLDTATNTITCNSITYIANQTTTGTSLGLGNITKTGCSVINASNLAAAGTGNNRTVYVTYTYTVTDTFSSTVVSSMRSNFTSGVDNVSAKIPTILLIVAVVFLFGALVLLVRQASNMGVSGGSGSL